MIFVLIYSKDLFLDPKILLAEKELIELVFYVIIWYNVLKQLL